MSNLLGYRRLFAACLAVLLIGAPASAQLRSTVYVSGLSSPVAFVQDPSNATLQYVVEQGGGIKVVQNGTVLPTLFLDISTLVSGGTARPGLSAQLRIVRPVLRLLHQHRRPYRRLEVSPIEQSARRRRGIPLRPPLA